MLLASVFNMIPTARRRGISLLWKLYLRLHIELARMHQAVADAEQAQGQDQVQGQDEGQGQGQATRRRRRPRKKRSCAVDAQNLPQVRVQEGAYQTTVLRYIRQRRHGKFRGFLRVSIALFLEILEKVTPALAVPQRTKYTLEPGLKVALTIRHLATGDSYPSLSQAFRVGVSTICTFIPKVCKAIADAYQQEAFPLKKARAADWEAIAQVFERRWQFPHCIGAIDGKHCPIRKPKKSGSEFWSYKGGFSINILAIADADCNFIWVELGGKGGHGDTTIFYSCELYSSLQRNLSDLPVPRPLSDHPLDTSNVPYYLLGDDAFALEPYLMKPFKGVQLCNKRRRYNYRLSRARRVVENAFGILVHRWRFLMRTCEQTPDHVRTMLRTAIVLHNVIRRRDPARAATEMDREDDSHNLLPGSWRAADITPLHSIPKPRQRTRTGRKRNPQAVEADRIQRVLVEWFSGDGKVPWQDKMANCRPEYENVESD